MPRPVRKKITTGRPVNAAPVSAKSAAAAKKAAAASLPPDRISSDSDEIVRKLQRGPRKYDTRVGDEHLMAGGLGERDEPSAHRLLDAQNQSLQRRRSELRAEDAAKKAAKATKRKSTATAKKEREEAERSTPASTAQKTGRGPPTPRAIESTLQGTGKLRRTTTATPRSVAKPLGEVAPGAVIRNRETRMVERVTDSFVMSDALSKPSVATATAPPTAPPTARRVTGTPLLANFKRRSRQNSLLHEVQQVAKARDTDVEADALGEDELDTSLLTLGDLSAPGSTHAGNGTSPAHSSSSRKRKRGGSGAISTIAPSPGSPPGSSPPIETHPQQQSPKATYAVEDPQDGHHALPLPDRMSDWEREAQEPTEETAKAAPKVQRGRKPRQARELSPVVATSPVSSPLSTPPPSSVLDSSPSETGRPASKSTKMSKGIPLEPKPVARVKKKMAHMTTEALQNLLPQCKRRPKVCSRRTDEFDILSTGSDEAGGSSPPISEDEDEDADELARPSRRRRATSANIRGGPKGKATKSTKTDKTPARGKLSMVKVASAGARKTYGRMQAEASGSDADQSQAEIDSEAGANGTGTKKTKKGKQQGKRKTSAELVEAAKKFAEVDEYEMDFESADIGAGGSSSPWR